MSEEISFLSLLMMEIGDGNDISMVIEQELRLVQIGAMVVRGLNHPDSLSSSGVRLGA